MNPENDPASVSIMSMDTRFDHAVHRPPARQIAALLSRTPVSPNALTVLSLVPAFMASAMFYSGTGMQAGLGILMFYAWAVLDHADGELARRTGKTSAFGMKLDDTCDDIASNTMLIGIYAGSVRQMSAHHAFWIFAFIAAMLLNIASGMLVLKEKRITRERLKGDPANADASVKQQKILDHFTGREPFYILLLIYWIFTSGFQAGIGYFVMVMLSGCYVMSFVSFTAYFLMKKESNRANQ